MKLRILFDDNIYDKTLRGGFGFSCYLEHFDEKILFDAGGNADIFNQNSTELKVTPAQITKVIFSHKHLDHIAGGEDFLKQIPQTTPIFIPSTFPELQLSKIPKYLPFKITDKVFETIGNGIHLLKLEGKYLSNIIYEQSLIIETEKGLVVVTGCAHPGIIRILETVLAHLPAQKIYAVIGGMHLHHSWFWNIYSVVKKIRALGISQVVPCHCSGKTASKYFENRFKENFIKGGVGRIIEF